ncbi:MAG: peptide/nickel transport system substrate-binding protein [Gaiellaceae bacterium]|nr:peptide/nickel transport system substrate-binding protein [Gaiellaceae bacterium]
MRRRNRWTTVAGIAAAAVALAFVAAGCGGSKSSSGGTTTAASGGTSGTVKTKTFPVLRAAWTTGIDFMDPGLAYTVDSWSILWNVYTPLLGYKHVGGPDGATLVPALTDALPDVSSDGLTYKLKLIKGLKYSDGSPVKASDFRATIERDYKLDSPGVGFFSNIVGADEFAKTKTGHITGITTDDATGAITIKLKAPQGDFTNILGTEFAAPVPANTPAKDQSTSPPPSTGPYMIQSYKPNKSFVVVRNPNFKPTANVPDGNPDKVVGTILEDDTAALQQTLNNTADYDFHSIPTDRLAAIQNKYPDQLKIYTPANTYYFFVNTRQRPFDKVQVRQAVNYAIDRDALVRLYGGLANPTENVLPPTYPQYKKISMYPHDVAKAKQLIKAAGATGQAVTVWGNDSETSKKPVAYLADVLNSIGLKAKLKIVNASVYWTTIGNQATKAQIGFADWFQDYPHPLDWFDVLLNGNRITQTHNNNYSNANNPAINAKIDALKKQPKLTASVNQQWADVDKMVAQQALWVPYINRQFTDFFGKDVDTSCYITHVLYQFDFSRICKK